MSDVIRLLLADFLRGLLTLLVIALVLTPFLWLVMQPWGLIAVSVLLAVLVITVIGAMLREDGLL